MSQNSPKSKCQKRSDEQSEIELEIKNLNLSNMTHIEALVKLSELQNQLR